MAAPQTHFVATFFFRAILSFVFGIVFSKLELACIYFWGCFLDLADHFSSSSYVKDVFQVRLPRFLKGGDVGSPSKGVEIPTCWFHLWPGAILSGICGLVFFPLATIWSPFFFWLQHKLIDDGQENDGSYPEVPFFYPFKKKYWTMKKGYPIKSREEVLVSTIIAILVVLFEVYYNFLK